jgi:cytochrome c-type biogenesis protein CcmH
MTTFLAATALAITLVMVLLLRPFWWRRQHTTNTAPRSHRQLNAAIYRDQFERLERDLAQNMLTPADYEQAKTELQRRILDEEGSVEAAAALRTPHKTIIALLLLIPVGSVALYLLLGNPAALAPPTEPTYTEADVERMISTLAQKLEKEPNNPKGWGMLASAYQALGRTQDAEAALTRAGDVVLGDAQLLALHADLAATNANGNFAGKPAKLIQKALALDPQNAMALWLAGSAAMQERNYPLAIQTWERLASLLPSDSDEIKTLQTAIDDARSQLGSAKKGKGNTKASPAASISGVVELAPALQAQVAPTDTVLVIARAPGARMPVAVLRARATQLPLAFTLDDSLSMSPNSAFSHNNAVELEARISKSGMAQPEAGDLISSVQTVAMGARKVTVRVDKVR